MTLDADEMLNIGPQELLVILVIALVVVGPQRLPQLGRSIGHWVAELRRAQDEVKRTIRAGLDEPSDPVAGAREPAESSVKEPINPTPPGAQDPTPTIGATPSAEEVREISRSLGRSLGQLRRAREDVQRSFRVDLGVSQPRPSSNGPSTRNGSPLDLSPPGDHPRSPEGEDTAPDGSAPGQGGSGGGDQSQR